MTQAEEAVELFESGFNCAQAMLLAFSAPGDLDRKTAARLASGFGGGMGCMAGTCGAVTGAFMVLGLRHGAASHDDKAAKDRAYRLMREFAARFRERNQSLDCRDLLGCDISQPAGMETARQKGLFGAICPRMVKDAAEIVEAMERKVRLLFLCTGNSCRSQMAEGWCRALHGDRIEAYSAGIETHGLNPRAVQVMAEAGVDIGGHRSKSVTELQEVPFDCVVTVCAHARESCPRWLGRTARVVHAGFDDPPALARNARTAEEALAHYRRVRDEIRAFVEELPEKLELSR